MQRTILKVLHDGRFRTIRELTIEVYENRVVVMRLPPSPKQLVAVRRAVRGLVALALVERFEGHINGIFVRRTRK